MNTAVRDAWAAELAVDRAQEWEDTQTARAMMRRKLDNMRHAKAAFEAEVQRYPLREGSSHMRDVPISPDGDLPPRLAKAMADLAEENMRLLKRGLLQLRYRGYVDSVDDTSRLVGTSSEFMVHRSAASIIQERLEAPVRMPKVRKVQAALDAMYQPDPAPQDARPWSAWGQL